jgi:hypothetical protein
MVSSIYDLYKQQNRQASRLDPYKKNPIIVRRNGDDSFWEAHVSEQAK